MKLKYNTPQTISLFIIFIMSLSLSTTLTISQSGTRFADTMTGDFYSLAVAGESVISYSKEFNLWNATNPSDAVRTENQINWEITTYEGWLDVQFALDANVSGDTWVRTQRKTTNIFPSQSGGSEYLFDKFDSNTPFNNTLPVEDHLNQVQNDEDISPIRSNSTYSVIFDELLEREASTDLPINFLNDNSQPTAPEIATMDWLSTSVENKEWFINGASLTINTKIITALFSINWEASSVIFFPVGDTDPVSFEVNQTLIYQTLKMYYYDDTNGVFLGSNSTTTGNYEAFMWNNNFQITRQGIADSEFSASNQSVYFDINTVDSFLVNQTSNGYGNIRPASTGSNNLETGDSLFYNLESKSNSDSFYDSSFSDSFGTRSRREVEKNSVEGLGKREMRIWRHEPGLVEVVDIMSGESTGTKNRNVTEPNPDFPSEFHYDTLFEVFFEIDFLESSSSTEHELERDLDLTKPLDFSENNGCIKCVDNGFSVPILREMPLISQTHETYISSEIGDSPLFINGFNYIVEVEALRGEYIIEWSGFADMWIGEGTDRVFVKAPVTVTAWAIQGFYWDTKTGVLLAIEEESRVEITINIGLMNYGSFIRIDLTSSTVIENRFFQLLKTHPNQYLTEQAEFPVTVDTTTTTFDSSPFNPDDTKSNSDDSPLPVEILPVLSGLAIITPYKRRRKRIE